MRYVLYIDVFMAVNFIMDLSVISAAAKFLSRKISVTRKICAAFSGTVLSALLIVSRINSLLLRRIIAYFIIIFIMTYIGFEPKTKKEWLTEVIVMYCITFVMSGAMEGLYYFISSEYSQKYGITVIRFICIATGGYFVTDMAIKAIKKRSIKGNHISDIYMVSIKKGNNIVRVRGLYDSGNSLREPYTKRAVHIACNSVINRLLDESAEASQKMYIVPYRAIGNEHGILKAYEMDMIMLLNDTENIILDKPLVGCYEGEVSADGSYEIILNRNI